MNVIDSFMVSLGFAVDTKGLDQMKAKVESAKSSILSWGSAITAVVGGATLKAVADLGSSFEDNKIAIAGFFNALGITSDFNAGLAEADKTLQSINKAAAALPGEAEEYVEVFRAALPFLQAGLPGASVADMTAFTNQLTAVAKTADKQLNSSVIASESAMLLGVQGRAGAHIRLFQALLPTMRKVQGQAHLTAESFNAMTQPKRVALLEASFVGMQPALDAAAKSFDAMWGAAVSGAKQMVRLGTAGLFESMKKALAGINALFFDTDGNLTKTGRSIVDMLGKIGDVVGAAVTGVTVFAKWLAEDDDAASTLKFALIALAGLLLPVVGWIALLAQDLWGYFHGMDSVTGELVNEWAPALYLIIGLLAAVTAAFSPWLLAIGAVIFGVYELKRHWQEVLDFVEGGLNGWVNVLNKVIDGMNAVNRFLGADDAHMNKHFEAFGFAGKNRNSEWAQGNLAEGGGVLAPGSVPTYDKDIHGNKLILPANGPAAGAPGQMWTPGFSMATAGGATVNNVNNGDNIFHITAPDANAAGEAVARRLSRNSQSGLVR